MTEGSTILLVDDSPTQRLALATLVEEAGHARVHAADSAASALEFLQARAPNTVGIVLMDLDMPEVDGIEACRRVRALPGYEDMPVIMVTSSADRAHLQRAFAAGAVDYITKPPDAVELSARMHSALWLKCEMDRRKARELALSRSEQRLSDILGSALDAILTLGADHRVTLFNRAAERMFRCEAADAIGAPIERFIAAGSQQVLRAFLDDDGSQRRQLWAPEGLYARRGDGHEFPIEVTVSPVTIDDSHHHTLILRDITERDRAATTLRQLQAEHRTLREVLHRAQQIDGFIGEAPSMQPVFEAIRRVAPADTTVLVTGETGSGKELIARAIHDGSPRRERPLVPVNCAALPAELIESELFGHERGAFTGATGLRRGRFELANGGTIFLDEVGELTAQAQAKLLRVLQEQRFERVGGMQPISVDVRVIAATNRHLQDMVTRGEFRADLYYRLNVFPIRVPPLRERRSDVPLLAHFFLEKCGRKLGKEFTGFMPVTLERLRRYNWPGNVRELQNVIERAVILGEPPLLEVADPLLAVADGAAAASPASGAVDDVVRAHILSVLEEHRWIIEGPRGAAAVLNMKPSTLRYRMKQLGIAKVVGRRA